MTGTIPSTFKAYTADNEGEAFERGVVSLSADDLPEGDVTVRCEFSGVNFKDGLAATSNGRVARISPLVIGIDIAGVVVESSASDFPIGTRVIAHGYDIGVARHGGFAEYARVPSDWLVALPETLSTRDAAAIGTAGFTAAMSVDALEQRGLKSDDGPVLVLGATGGVGSMAVGMLASRGYEVFASTGKPDAADWLRAVGAAEVLDRTETSSDSTKPIESERWAAAVDPVGGAPLAYVLRSLRYGGAVASSGLTAGTGLTTTVLPFILRAVALIGIDSVQVPIQRRRALWERVANDLRPPHLDGDLIKAVPLEGVDAALDGILAGQARGRTVVELGTPALEAA